MSDSSEICSFLMVTILKDSTLQRRVVLQQSTYFKKLVKSSDTTSQPGQRQRPLSNRAPVASGMLWEQRCLSEIIYQCVELEVLSDLQCGTRGRPFEKEQKVERYWAAVAQYVDRTQNSIPSSSGQHVQVSLGKPLNPKLFPMLRHQCVNVCK